MSDFTPIIDRGVSEDVDGIFASLVQGGIPFATQWAQRKPNFGIGGFDVNSAMPAHYDATEGAVEYIWTNVPGATAGARPTDLTTQVIEQYTDEYGHPPEHSQAYTAYDGLLALRKAAENAGTTDSDAIVDELEELQFEGTTGYIEFYPGDHEWAHDPRYGEDHVQPPFIQWQEIDGEGQQVGIWPEAVKAGEYQHPPWIE